MKYSLNISIEVEGKSINLPTSTIAEFQRKFITWNYSENVYVNDYTYMVIFEFSNFQDIREEKINEIYNRVLDEIKTYTKPEKIKKSYPFLQITILQDKIDLPSSPIDYNGQIRLILNNEHTSLSKINKLIKKCSQLDIFWTDHITSSILGLLLIGFPKINFYSNKNKPQWVSIIKKYLDAHNNDVLECQEELIENGFKELAKL